MVLYSEIGGHVLTPFLARVKNDQSGLIGRRKVTVYGDRRVLMKINL
jgi:hypothetical protein